MRFLTVRSWMLVALLALLPLRAVAGCDEGSAPSYQDVTYVKVEQYSLVGILHPWYTFEASLSPLPSMQLQANASLVAKRAVKVFGNFVAVNPRGTFKSVVGVLERDRFFDMRLNPAKQRYLDGPEDRLTVGRCGVTTTLSTIAPATAVDLGDAQGVRFFKLEDDVRNAIFAEQWMTPP